jgi:putative endonuclease
VTDARRALGAAGEAAARAYLERNGYRILDQNTRWGGVEIDIVALRRSVVVFVEVKTRRGASHGGAAEAVDARKRRRLARGAAAWLSESRRRPRGVRFDVITCEPAPGDGFRVTHWKSAFEAGD